jgi:hypothetical protein
MGLLLEPMKKPSVDSALDPSHTATLELNDFSQQILWQMALLTFVVDGVLQSYEPRKRFLKGWCFIKAMASPVYELATAVSTGHIIWLMALPQAPPPTTKC